MEILQQIQSLNRGSSGSSASCARTLQGAESILDNLSRDSAAVCDGVHSTNSFEELVARLGYRVNDDKQIHVADATRAWAGGRDQSGSSLFRYSDAQRLPTLVNYDSTVTATPKSAAIFNDAGRAKSDNWERESVES